jgi:Tfp pilus assembly protein PilF
MKLGQLLVEQGNLDLAEIVIKRAQSGFPQYAGADSSYAVLSALYLQQGKNAEAEQQLSRMISIDAENYEAHLQLAKLRAQHGDHAGASMALQAAVYIYPYEAELHEQLAFHLEKQSLWREVARERRALLALDPFDRAEAYYQLAYAYSQAGNRPAARQQIIYALEIAPNFRRAQDLLLALRIN